MENITPPPWKRRQEQLERRLANMRRRTRADRTVSDYGQPHVYFAYSAGRIKIGTSLYPVKRGGCLDGQSSHPVTIIMVIPGGLDLERKFHDVLASERVHGEWFRLSEGARWFLHRTLCAAGMRRFKKAEREFQAWVREEGAA